MFDESHLQGIRVLELVDEHEVESLRPAPARLGVAPEQPHRQGDEIGEVQGLRGREALLVARVDPRGLGVAIPFRLLGGLLGPQQRVLVALDHRAGGLRREAALGQRQLLEDALEQGELVVGVVDRELAGEAERLPLPAQDLDARGVKGAEPEIAGLAAEALLETRAHFAGGLVGEGEAEDAPGRRALAHQAPDPLGEHAGLAAAGAGDDEAGPLTVVHGLLLGRIEL